MAAKGVKRQTIWRALCVHLVRWLPLVALFLAMPAWSQGVDQNWSLGAGQEPAVLQWLGPLTEGAVVLPPWRVADVAISADRVRLRMHDGSSAPGWWLTLTVAGATPQLQAHSLPEAPTTLVQEATKLAGQLALPGPWRSQHPKAPIVPAASASGLHFSVAARPVLTAWQTLRENNRLEILVLWLALILAAALALSRWLQTHRPTLPQMLGMAALLVLALIVRLLWAPQTLLHEFYHAANTTIFLTDPSLPSVHGEALSAPALLLHLLNHRDIENLFKLDLLGSVLSVPLLMALDAALFGWRPSVWLTGLLLALLPMHVRYSACEESWSWGLVLLCGSVVAWHAWLARPSWLHLTVCALSLVLATQMRPEWLLAPVALAAFWLLSGQSILRRRQLWVFLLPVAAFFLAHLLANAGASGHRPSRPNFAHYALLADGMTSPALLALGLLGTVWALRHGLWRPTLWVLGVHGALTAVELSFFANVGAYVERVQIVPVALVLPLAARAADALATWFSVRLAATAVALVAVAQFATRLPVVTRLSASQDEWEFLEETAPALPQHFSLLALSPTAAFGGYPELPLVRAHRSAEWLDLIAAHQHNAWPPPSADLVVYLGMSCWMEIADSAGNMQSVIDACRAARLHYALSPLVERNLLPRPDPPAHHLPPGPNGYLIGYYRAERLRAAR